MFSALRARKIENNLVQPFVELENFSNATCDRNSQGDTYFIDCSCFVVRSTFIEDLEKGLPPFRWIGNKVFPIIQWGGIDIDKEWQLGQVLFWLEQHGFSNNKTPYENDQI